MWDLKTLRKINETKEKLEGSYPSPEPVIPDGIPDGYIMKHGFLEPDDCSFGDAGC